MSSVPPDPNELLRLLLAQQQQQQMSAAPFAVMAPSYQEQTTEMPPPAPASQPSETAVPSLSQLLEYLQAVGSTKAANTPTPAALKHQENYEQLQRYLQASGVMHASHSAAASATAKQSRSLPQGDETMRALPHDSFASYPAQVKQDLQQLNRQAQQHQQSHNQLQQQHHQHQAQQLIKQQNLSLQESQDSILASLRLLAEINPDMATLAVMQALNMSSLSSQSQLQCYRGSHSELQPQKHLHPRHAFGQNQHQQSSTPSPFSFCQQKHLLPTPPGNAPIATGCARSSAPTPTPSPMRNHDNLNKPSTNKGIIKPNKDDDISVAANGVLLPPPPVRQGTESPSTGSIFSRRAIPGAASQRLDNGSNLEGERAAQPSVGKAKSEKKKLSRASKQPKKKCPLHQNRTPPVAAASGVEQEPSAVSAAILSVPTLIPTPDKATLQSWSLELLEMHVQQLKHASQPIPQHLAVLLFNSRRKEEKRKAKRLANRKSATVSRARKRAFIEDMTKDNARLRKRAKLLEFLPDLVIAVNLEGEITFCGSQVEKVLKHNASKLMGVNIREIVAPNSERTMQRLIWDVVDPTQQQNNRAVAYGHENNSNGSKNTRDISLQSPEKSFPMFEVNAHVMQPSTEEYSSDLSTYRRCKEGNDRIIEFKNSDKTTMKEVASFSRQKILLGSEVMKSQSFETKASDENGKPTAKNVKTSFRECSESELSGKSSDRIINNVDNVMSGSVSVNTDDAKLSKLTPYPQIQTRENEDRPHKTHLMDLSRCCPKTFDVRSLTSVAESEHRSKKAERSAGFEDFIQPESNENEEKFNDSSEGSITSEKALEVNTGNRIQLSQVYKVRFIRGDLTTVWCKLTSSILSARSFFDDESSFDPKAALAAINNPRGLKSVDSSGDNTLSEEDEDEVLICIRPAHEGRKMEDGFQFARTVSVVNESEATSLSDENTHDVPIKAHGKLSSGETSSDRTRPQQGHPRNQQAVDKNHESDDRSCFSRPKKPIIGPHQGSTTGHDVQSIAESLVFMSNNSS